jgi:hypothetical protein
VRIEDGDASQAQRDLRAAEQKLREALQRGASDDEIRALTKELRDAAERYMRDLAEQDPGQEPDGSPVEQKDLESLLDRFENTARNGARQDAEAMLDQLQNMFENMKSARDAEADPTLRELRKQLNELDKLLRDQQALRDDTFRRDQRERMRRDGQKNDQPPQADEGDKDGQPTLEQQQRALRDRLAEMQQRLKGLGMKGAKGFDDAEGAMQDAEGDLKADGPGQPGDQDGAGAGEGKQTRKGEAVEAQGRALQAMRDGAQSLQQQMQGGGQGGYPATARRPGDPRNGLDPLGRETGDQRGATEGVLNGGADVAERARRVLQELRRRLADPNRPGDERDYLERLMRRD